MARVLITGGTGFIGSHLASHMASMSYEVLVYGTCQFYCRPSLTLGRGMRDRFEELLHGVKVVYGSTLEALEMRRVMNAFKPHFVVHLAATSLASAANKRREEAFDSLLRGLFNVLEIFADEHPALYSPSHLTYVSSSMVYGDFAQIPMPEDGPKNPKNLYGAMKLMGETLVRSYESLYSVPCTIVRPSAVYGPGDVNNRVLQIFVENAINGEPIRLNGNPCMDFTYIDDLVLGLERASTSQAAIGETFNITRGDGRTLEEAVGILKSHFPGLEVIMGREMPGTPKRGSLDIAKARKILHYEPRYSLERGLEEYLGYYL